MQEPYKKKSHLSNKTDRIAAETKWGVSASCLWWDNSLFLNKQWEKIAVHNSIYALHFDQYHTISIGVTEQCDELFLKQMREI